MTVKRNRLLLVLLIMALAVSLLSACGTQKSDEEITQQILLPALEEPHIRFTAEYSEKEGHLTLKVLYNGASFDPADSENQLSYAMLKNAVSDLRHVSLTDGDFANRLDGVITERAGA